MSFGASHFLVLTDQAALAKARCSLDFLLVTALAELDWVKLVDLLKPNGTLCVVGAAATPVVVPTFALIVGQKSICGSNIGSRTSIGEMLDFAARHGIAATTEVVPMAAANEAIARMRAGRARYRMVLAS